MPRAFEFLLHILRYLFHKLFFNYYSFGTKIAIDRNVRISNACGISIGDAVHLQDNVWLNVISGEKKLILRIGNGCDIGRSCFLSVKSSLILEDDVLLSPNVIISDHAHVTDNLSLPILKSGITAPKSVHIGSGSWIGANCVILPGVSIGKHCVIGANSVVNKSIPNHCIAVGSPAKVVKIIK